MGSGASGASIGEKAEPILAWLESAGLRRDQVPRRWLPYLAKKGVPSITIEEWWELPYYDQVQVLGKAVTDLLYVRHRPTTWPFDFNLPLTVLHPLADRFGSRDGERAWLYADFISLAWGDNVYLGPCPVASSSRSSSASIDFMLGALDSYGVTDVVQIMSSPHPLPSRFNVHLFQCEDGWPPSHVMASAADKIHALVEKGDCVIYIHCRLGMLRSTHALLYYLVKYGHFDDVEKAWEHIAARRPIAQDTPYLRDKIREELCPEPSSM